MIECEKESNSHQEMGDLGIRVQTGGTTSDPTAKKAIRNVMTLEALINCDFSGDVMEGVNRAEEFIRDAYLLRDMRKDYDLFNRQLSILGTEKETFEKYLRREKSLDDIAEEHGITYESAQQKIHKIRTRVKNRLLVSWMERWEVLRNGRKAMLYRQGAAGDSGNQQTDSI